MNEQGKALQIDGVNMENKVAVAHAYARYLKERAYYIALTEEAQNKLDAEYCIDCARDSFVEPTILANYIEIMDGKRPDFFADDVV